MKQEITDAATKILTKFEEKKIKLNKKEVIEDLTRLVDTKFDFVLPLPDAVRTVIGKYARKHNVKIYEGGSSEVKEIKSVAAGDWVTVEAKVLTVDKPASDKIHQTAMVNDGTGTIKVTVWSRDRDVERVVDMVPGKWYKISNVVVNSYKDALALGVQKSSTVAEIPSKGDIKANVVPIADLTIGIFDIRGKVVKLFEPRSDKMAMAGLVGDESGTIRFTIWKSQAPKKLPEEGKCYVFPSVACSTFNNMKSIQVSVGPTPIHGTIEVKKTTVEFLGNLVAIQEGSGLIRRCTVDGCRRALSRQSYCPIHEIQKDFQYDMRIKGVIDMGDKVYSIHIPLEQVEKISSMALDQAIEIAKNNPLGPDEVLMQLRDKLVGRYYKVEGSEFQDRVLVSSIYRASLSDIKQSTGLDFTKVQSTVEVG